MVARDLTDDPVFGRISQLTIEDFADSQRTARLRDACHSAEGVTLILGTGTALVVPDPDVLILADLARWEIQRRQRANQIGNFPAGDLHASPAAKYKRAYFVDWRVADRIKRDLLKRCRLSTRYQRSNDPEDDAPARLFERGCNPLRHDPFVWFRFSIPVPGADSGCAKYVICLMVRRTMHGALIVFQKKTAFFWIWQG